jgi:phage regulator Rha-like protein
MTAVTQKEIPMNEITIIEVSGNLVVDSRIIAEQLDIQHRNLIGTIKKHQATIEGNFGGVAFKTEAETNTASGQTNQVVFCYLNEDQATFIMTLSRNTEKVIKCKVGLVKAFSYQKRRLENPVDRALYNELAQRIAKLEIQSAPALPRANVDPIPQPIAPLTERASINRLVRSYVHHQTAAQPKNEQDVYRWIEITFHH